MHFTWMLHFCCLSDLRRIYASLDTRNPINDNKKVPSARMSDEGPNNCIIETENRPEIKCQKYFFINV